MGRILRIGFRQINAIREQVVHALGCVLDGQSVVQWIQDKEPELAPFLQHMNVPDLGSARESRDAGSPNPASFLHALILNMESEKRKEPEFARYWRESRVTTSQSDHAEEDDFGADKGGAWDTESFVLRSGIVFTLAAQEDFERGIVRVLTTIKRHPPLGEGEVFHPSLADFEYENTEWKQIERNTWKCQDRRDLLRKFGLELPHRADWAERLKAAWKARNEVAHDTQRGTVTLAQFLQTHYDVFSAMNYWASECLTKLRIDI